MTIPPIAQRRALQAPSATMPFVNPQTGALSPSGSQLLQRWQTTINGANLITPCTAAGANLITLTPFNVSPSLTAYADYEVYAAVAAATSTGPVTATVVPQTGSLPTLPVYKSNGAAQASNGDIVVGLFYLFVYVDSLNAGGGGFVLK